MVLVVSAVNARITWGKYGWFYSLVSLELTEV